jgi:hypothetical protein
MRGKCCAQINQPYKPLGWGERLIYSWHVPASWQVIGQHLPAGETWGMRRFPVCLGRQVSADGSKSLVFRLRFWNLDGERAGKCSMYSPAPEAN